MPLALVLALPTSASAETFGADLSAPALNGGGCPADSFFTDKGGPSCLITTAGPPGEAPSQSGIVNTVRVKTGDFPQGNGKMQVVVERSFSQNSVNPNTGQPDPGHPNFFCCFIQQYGPTFTPQRNTINTIHNADLGLVEQPVPPPDDTHSVAKQDFLSLSVFGSDVPLPMGQDPNAFLTYRTPAPTPGHPPAPSPNPYFGNTNGELGGFELMMNADLQPLGGGGNAVTFGNPKLNGNKVGIPVTCVLDTTCQGVIQLLEKGVAAAAKNAPVLGKTSFSVGPQQTARIKVKLNSTGKKALRTHGSLRVIIKANVAGQVTKTTATLRRKNH